MGREDLEMEEINNYQSSFLQRNQTVAEGGHGIEESLCWVLFHFLKIGDVVVYSIEGVVDKSPSFFHMILDSVTATECR